MRVLLGVRLNVKRLVAIGSNGIECSRLVRLGQIEIGPHKCDLVKISLMTFSCPKFNPISPVTQSNKIKKSHCFRSGMGKKEGTWKVGKNAKFLLNNRKT